MVQPAVTSHSRRVLRDLCRIEPPKNSSTQTQSGSSGRGVASKAVDVLDVDGVGLDAQWVADVTHRSGQRHPLLST